MKEEERKNEEGKAMEGGEVGREKCEGSGRREGGLCHEGERGERNIESVKKCRKKKE